MYSTEVLINQIESMIGIDSHYFAYQRKGILWSNVVNAHIGILEDSFCIITESNETYKVTLSSGLKSDSTILYWPEAQELIVGYLKDYLE